MPLNQRKARINPDRTLFGNKRTITSASTVSGVAQNSSDKLALSGEAIAVGDFVGIGSDGRVYKATAKYSDSIYAGYIAITDSTAANEDIQCRRYGEAEIQTTLTVNKPIYLTTGTPNYTQTPPTKTAEIDLLQYLGYASATNVIVINIKLPKRYV